MQIRDAFRSQERIFTTAYSLPYDEFNNSASPFLLIVIRFGVSRHEQLIERDFHPIAETR